MGSFVPVMHQGFVAGSLGEGVGIHEVGHPVALSRKASYIVSRGLARLLPTIVKVPWVSRAYVRALEISDENLFQVCTALDAPRAEAIKLGPHRTC